MTAPIKQAREALHAMLVQFTRIPSTLKDNEARVKAHAAIAAIDAQPAAVPLTQAQIVDGYCAAKHSQHYVAAFYAGARFAERAHGIGAAAQGGKHE